MDLSPVQTEDGRTFHLVQSDDDYGDRTAGQALVLLDVPKECVAKSYTLTLIHSASDADKTSFESSFKITQPGLQYVLMDFPLSLEIDAEWWVQLNGDQPLPTPKRLLLGDKDDASQADGGSPAAPQPSQQVVVAAGPASAPPAYCVIRPSTVVAVPPDRFVAPPRVVFRDGRRVVLPANGPRRLVRPLGPAGPDDPLANPVARAKLNHPRTAPADRPVKGPRSHPGSARARGR